MSTTTVYQYDRSGLYIGPTEADESPLEPGVYHLPARTTLCAPPLDCPDDQWPRWNGSVWTLASRPQQSDTNGAVAAEKLATFLRDNPDVAALVANAAPT